jgi:hypothetical protein
MLALAWPTGTAQAQPLWDVSGVVGLFTSHTTPDTARGYADDWVNAVQAGGTIGRYLSPHLKLEMEASATTRGLQYGAVPVMVDGVASPYPLFAEVRTSVRSVGGGVSWQFRDNEWVHPFVHAGVSVDWDDAVVLVPPQFYYGDPRRPAVPITDGYTEQRTTTHLRGVVGGGAKVYFTERAFVRTDGRVAWGRDRQTLVLRAGVGIDF